MDLRRIVNVIESWDTTPLLRLGAYIKPFRFRMNKGRRRRGDQPAYLPLYMYQKRSVPPAPTQWHSAHNCLRLLRLGARPGAIAIHVSIITRDATRHRAFRVWGSSTGLCRALHAAALPMSDVMEASKGAWR